MAPCSVVEGCGEQLQGYQFGDLGAYHPLEVFIVAQAGWDYRQNLTIVPDIRPVGKLLPVFPRIEGRSAPSLGGDWAERWE